jgi:hypothetical protein
MRPYHYEELNQAFEARRNGSRSSMSQFDQVTDALATYKTQRAEKCQGGRAGREMPSLISPSMPIAKIA